MVIALIGESCVGKSTLAAYLKETLSATIYTGKDYLRMDKNKDLAEKKFMETLQLVPKNDFVLYIISEKEQLSFLPSDAYRLVLTANLDTIKERFKKRMHGVLPLPVEKMLEIKHGMFDEIPSNDLIQTDNYKMEDVLNKILKHQE